MADIPQIPEWSGARLNNGQFLNYAKDVARIAAGFPSETFPIAEKITALNALTAKLTDFINETRKAAETADVAAADARRDLIFRAVWSFLDYTGRLDGSDSFSKAARQVQALISPYKGAASHPLTKETEEINGLQFDMEKDAATAEAVMTLGLANALSELYAANRTVRDAYTQRADANAARDAAHFGESTASVRKDTLNAVLEIIQILNALVRLTPTSEVRDATIRMIQAVEQHKAVAAQNGKHQHQPEGGDDGESGGDGGGAAPETAQ